MDKGQKVKRFKIPTIIKTFSFDKFVPWTRIDGDEHTLYAADSRNCDCIDGTIKMGATTQIYRNDAGVVKYPIEASKVDRFFYTYKREIGGDYTPILGLMSKSGRYYYLPKNSVNFIQQAAVVKGDFYDMAPYFDSDRELYMLLFGENGVTSVQANMYEGSSVGDRFECGCVLDDRAYGVVEHNAIWYSAPLDVLNFDSNLHDGGRLYAQCDKGKTVALKPLGKKLYLFYEYGIVEIETAGSGTNFKMKKISYAGGKIMSGCVGECMGKLYFFALDGVYALDHNGVEKKFKKLQLKGADTEQKGSFAIYNGGFFLRYYDEVGAWKTIFLEPAWDSGYKTMDMPAVSALDGEVFYADARTIQRVVANGSMPSGERAFFLSEALLFGTTEMKLLKSLRFTGRGGFLVRIFNGKEWNLYRQLFSDGVASIEPKLSGREFKIEIAPDKGSMISTVSGEIECVRRG